MLDVAFAPHFLDPLLEFLAQYQTEKVRRATMMEILMMIEMMLIEMIEMIMMDMIDITIVMIYSLL